MYLVNHVLRMSDSNNQRWLRIAILDYGIILLYDLLMIYPTGAEPDMSQADKYDSAVQKGDTLMIYIDNIQTLSKCTI